MVSRNAFTRLAVAMMGFGLLIGLIFPFAVLTVGVDRGIALGLVFFLFTVSAGLMVGGVNIVLARLLVRPRLTEMAERMQQVERGLTEATYTGDWSECDPATCALPVESDDEFGRAADAFNSLITTLASSHEVQTRMSSFTDAMASELEVDGLSVAGIRYFMHDLGAGAVAVLGRSRGEIRVLATHAIDDSPSLVDSDIVQRAMRSREPQFLTLGDTIAIDAGITKVTPRGVAVYPLMVQSAAIGAVVLAFTEDQTPASKLLAPTLMRTFAVGLANALAHESMQHLAAVDPLTGLYNRRFGLTRLHEEYVRSIRSGQPVGVVMVDIDHFKAVNDTYGHLTGDMVLKNVSAEAKSVLRDGDILLRYGGEELLAVLPGAGQDDAMEIAERIRRLTEGVVHRTNGSEIKVTISAGYASTAAVDVDGEMDLVEKADVALYEAKQAGRNQSVAAS